MGKDISKKKRFILSDAYNRLRSEVNQLNRPNIKSFQIGPHK